VVQQLKLMGPTNKNHFFLCYQTLKYVVAGESHPQPHYQTTSLLVEFKAVQRELSWEAVHVDKKTTLWL